MIRALAISALLFAFNLTTPAQDSDYWKNYKKRTDAPIPSPKTSSAVTTNLGNTLTTKSYNGAGLVIYQSPEITALSARFKNENANGTKLKGYKVQVFFGERGRANGIKAEFETSYPEIPADITYLAPNFRVRVGNFRSNLDAERFLKEIKGLYTSAYIVPDEIDLPSL